MMGQYIRDSALLNEEFEADFINLSTSTQMKEIGKGGWKKISNTLKIQAKVLKALTRKRYDLCYFTLNSTGPGFHKDLLVVAILKLFGKKIRPAGPHNDQSPGKGWEKAGCFCCCGTQICTTGS